MKEKYQPVCVFEMLLKYRDSYNIFLQEAYIDILKHNQAN